MSNKRVVVVDAEPLLRRHLVYLAEKAGCKIVGEATGYDDALDLISKTSIDSQTFFL